MDFVWISAQVQFLEDEKAVLAEEAAARESSAPPDDDRDLLSLRSALAIM